MERLAKRQSGIVPILEGHSNAYLGARVEATKDLPSLSAYVLLDNVSTYRSTLVENMQEVRRHTDTPVVLWREFYTFDVYGKGIPAVTVNTIERAVDAGMAGVMGFLQKDKAKETIQFALEKKITIVFAGASQDGYLTAYLLGLRDFFLGYDQDHIDAMRQMMHNDSQFWVAPARQEEVLTTALASRNTRRFHVMVPSNLTIAEVEGVARRMTE